MSFLFNCCCKTTAILPEPQIVTKATKEKEQKPKDPLSKAVEAARSKGLQQNMEGRTIRLGSVSNRIQRIPDNNFLDSPTLVGKRAPLKPLAPHLTISPSRQSPHSLKNSKANHQEHESKTMEEIRPLSIIDLLEEHSRSLPSNRLPFSPRPLLASFPFSPDKSPARRIPPSQSASHEESQRARSCGSSSYTQESLGESS